MDFTQQLFNTMKHKGSNLFGVIVGVLICIAFYAFLPYWKDNTIIIGWIIIGICALTFFLLFLYLQQDKTKELKKKLLKESAFIFQNSAIAWFIGLWVASFITAIVLLFFGYGKYPSLANVNPSAFDIVSIYVGSVFGVLAIRAFFEEMHPIYDELELIRKITEDLNDAKKSTTIWFSFPAFNLCHFRIATGYVKPKHNELSNFFNALGKTISDNEYEFNGICYTIDNINKLYDKYGEINADIAEETILSDAINKCKDKAKNFVEQMQSAASTNQRTKHHIMNPENPIENFFIIGNIVYTIQAWGMPVFKDGEFQDPFQGIQPDEKLVSLIAYRQNDGELAKSIITRAQFIVR